MDSKTLLVYLGIIISLTPSTSTTSPEIQQKKTSHWTIDKLKLVMEDIQWIIIEHSKQRRYLIWSPFIIPDTNSLLLQMYQCYSYHHKSAIPVTIQRNPYSSLVLQSLASSPRFGNLATIFRQLLQDIQSKKKQIVLQQRQALQNTRLLRYGKKNTTYGTFSIP